MAACYSFAHLDGSLMTNTIIINTVDSIVISTYCIIVLTLHCIGIGTSYLYYSLVIGISITNMNILYYYAWNGQIGMLS